MWIQSAYHSQMKKQFLAQHLQVLDLSQNLVYSYYKISAYLYDKHSRPFLHNFMGSQKKNYIYKVLIKCLQASDKMCPCFTSTVSEVTKHPKQKRPPRSHSPGRPPIQPLFQPVRMPYMEPHRGWIPPQHPPGPYMDPHFMARQRTSKIWLYDHTLDKLTATQNTPICTVVVQLTLHSFIRGDILPFKMHWKRTVKPFMSHFVADIDSGIHGELTYSGIRNESTT